MATYIRWFDEIGLADVPLVGGKNASLGEMYRELTPRGIPVPNGFATTAAAYRDTITSAGLWDELAALMDGTRDATPAELARRGRRSRDLVYSAPLSPALRQEIVDAHQRLVAEHGEELTVAVRSSATAEDLPTASFAGQHETFLNVHGAERVVDAVKRCFASLFTDRAIAYRNDMGFDHLSIALSAGVMKMVRSDLAASGVMFTVDTESGHPDVVFVTSSYGLGENVVQGAVDPDEFYVHKPTYALGFRRVLRRSMGRKQMTMVYAQTRGGQTTANIPTADADRGRFSLSDDEVLILAGYAIEIERHSSESAGETRPMDIEWAKDGLDGKLYVVQARPETVVSQRAEGVFRSYVVTGTAPVLVSGRAVGSSVASGAARVVVDKTDLDLFEPGEILVADTTTPDWEPVMKTAAAIVTNRGGRTCHAAIVARELGIPAVVGTGTATERIATGRIATVSCADGDTGHVYDGAVPFETREISVTDTPRPRTHIMVNVGNPDGAFQMARLPVDGVGLARMEFIVSEAIRAHPMALLRPDLVEDPEERAAISDLTARHSDGAAYFVERLAEGVGTIAAAFYPKPVIVRMSDFKSNEYAALLGGRSFEPVEANPMLGFRGASRYTHPAYEPGFALECAAMRRVRDEMGLVNVKLMIPFCRRVEEGRRTLEVMAANGLTRGENGLEIYVMCEIPNNALQVDAFAELFDGFSIGSNDLTQLVLGVDRDSELVAFDFDERDAGVMEMIRMTIDGAHRHERHVGICGQGPSDYPEMAEALVRMGIDSISLNPDSILATTDRILELERAGGGPDTDA